MIVSKAHKRRGVSELVAAVMTIAVTLIAGAALFGYVNGQAASNENRIGDANAANVNFLNERFVVVDVNFSSSNPSNSVSVWIYNNGGVSLNVTQIELYNSTHSMDIFYQHNPASLSCTLRPLPTATLSTPHSNPLKLTVNLPGGCGFRFGPHTYYFNVLGVYGNSVVYSVCNSNRGCAS